MEEVRNAQNSGLMITINIKTMHRLFIFATIIFLSSYSLTANNVKQHNNERVYIQTDKSVYLSGEIIWLNMNCLTEKGNLSSFSKVGYVELLGDTSSIAQIRINLESSIGTGSLIIPSSIKSGYYQLVGYTRNMRNESSEIYFKKNIAIINPTLLETHNSLPIEESSSLAVESTKKDPEINDLNIQLNGSSFNTRSLGLIKLSNIPKDVKNLSISVFGSAPLEVPNYILQKEYITSSHFKDTLASSKNYFTPEYEGPIVLAKKIKEENLTSESKTFISFPGNDIRLFFGAEKNGYYEFITKNISGFEEAVLGTLSQEGAVKDLELISPFADDHTFHKLPALRLDSSYHDYIKSRSVGLQALYHYSLDSMTQLKNESPYFAPSPFRTYITEEYTRFLTISEIITEYIPLIRFRRALGARYLSVLDVETGTFPQGACLVLLDGIPIADHNVIYNYNADHIKRVDLYSGQYILGGNTFNSIVSFQTYQSNYPDLDFGNNLRLFNYKAPQKERVFYMPDYSHNKNNTIPDFRHTLLWIPRVHLEKNTPSTNIPFYTSDLVGKYDVIIEGITTDGQSVYAKSTFEVK